MRVLKFGRIEVACAVIVALASLVLFLCGAWLLESAPSVQRTALAALSLCASGIVALSRSGRYWTL
jgi:uncharacterized membrane protein YfcA